MKDFSRSQTVTYTVNVVISQTRARWSCCCNKPLIGSDVWPIELCDNSDDLESPSRSFAHSSLVICDRSYSCAAFDKISTDSASRGFSAIAELLVFNRFQHGLISAS